MLKKNMSHILTFVASDLTRHPLNDDFFSFLKTHNIDPAAALWLCNHRALDIALDQPMKAAAILALRNKLASFEVDVFYTTAENRQKKLLLADMDSTIVVGETLDELAAFAGVKTQVEEITARAMNGELDFHAALTERVALLKNLPIGALEETLNAMQLMPGADILLKTMKQNGAKTVLVTGGFTCFAEDVQNMLDFDYIHGNHLEIKDDVLTGAILPPILDKHAKLSYLKQYAKDLGIELSDAMTIGDGANDVPMLEAAGLGIGYEPKPLLQETLINQIRFNTLEAALYAQGYSGFEEDI